MILRCAYEELTAMTTTAQQALAASPWLGAAVIAPPEALVHLENLVPRLTGDLSLETLAEQQALEQALGFLVSFSKDRMDALIVEQYAESEDAVNAYFDYARIVAVRQRVREIGNEMAALIELMTGSPPTMETARRVTFGD
jgi:hypothetical protein